MQTDVVEGNRGAVLARAANGDLELARQPTELGVDAGPLPQDLAECAWVDGLVGPAQWLSTPPGFGEDA